MDGRCVCVCMDIAGKSSLAALYFPPLPVRLRTLSNINIHFNHLCYEYDCGCALYRQSPRYTRGLDALNVLKKLIWLSGRDITKKCIGSIYLISPSYRYRYIQMVNLSYYIIYNNGREFILDRDKVVQLLYIMEYVRNISFICFYTKQCMDYGTDLNLLKFFKKFI